MRLLRETPAGVGYDTDGASGSSPTGSDIGTGCDTFVGMSFDVSIGVADATEETVVTHTHGTDTPRQCRRSA